MRRSVAFAALLLTVRMYRGFEHTAVDRPVKRWVVAAVASPDDAPDATHRVESERDEPAAIGS